MRKPNFFILGAPKCGTTAMAEWLGANPHVYMSPIKEPHYYNRDLNYRIVKTEEEYLRLFEGAKPGHMAVGEGSVWYLYSDEAVVNILKDVPDAKFVVCLRNPVDMAYSLHGQQLWSCIENIRDFGAAWRAQSLRAKHKKVPLTCKEPRTLLYGQACSLGEQMSRLLELVPRKRVMPVFLSDVRGDPSRCYRNVLRFLGVPDDGRTQFGVVNEACELRYPRLHIVIEQVHLARKRLHVPRSYLGLAFAPFNRWNERLSTRPPIGDAMREELLEYFMPDINRLERVLGRDLTSWKSEAPTRRVTAA